MRHRPTHPRRAKNAALRNTPKAKQTRGHRDGVRTHEGQKVSKCRAIDDLRAREALDALADAE